MNLSKTWLFLKKITGNLAVETKIQRFIGTIAFLPTTRVEHEALMRRHPAFHSHAPLAALTGLKTMRHENSWRQGNKNANVLFPAKELYEGPLLIKELNGAEMGLYLLWYGG